MSNCGFDGNEDMYGLGIRIGFYLQWFGAIAADFLALNEVPNQRLTYCLFITAVFIALLSQISMSSLRPVEIYIVSLQAVGGFYAFAPVYLLQLWTGFDPRWDPSRSIRAEISSRYYVLVCLLMVALSCFQVWSWSTFISTSGWHCLQYGFFFMRVPLDNSAFVALHMLLNIFLLGYALTVICINVGWLGLKEPGDPIRWAKSPIMRY